MAKPKPAGADDVRTALRALLFDIPVAAGRWGTGKGEPSAIFAALWRSYDATIHLGGASIDRLYRSERFGRLLAVSIDGLLRWQRLNNAFAGAFFTALWRGVGLPTAAEMRALREELRSLAASIEAEREELARVEKRIKAFEQARLRRRRVPTAA
jgi:hypothetical protein